GTLLLLFVLLPARPFSTLFPYTTLFRSLLIIAGPAAVAGHAVDELRIRRDSHKKRKAQEWRKTWKSRYCLLTLSAAPSCTTSMRSEEHTSELQSRENLVCRLLLEKKKKN